MSQYAVVTPVQYFFNSGTNTVTIPITPPADHNMVWCGVGLAIGGGGHVTGATHAGNACSTQQAETFGNVLGYRTFYRSFTPGTGTGNVVVTVTGLVLGMVVVMTWNAANTATPFPDTPVAGFFFSGVTDQTIATQTGRRVFQFSILENLAAGGLSTTHGATDDAQMFYDPGGGTMWLGLCSLPGASSVTLGYSNSGTNVLAYTFTLEEAPAGACAVSGTVTPSVTIADIRAGGKTIILTLSGDTWVASGTAFNAIRQDIIDGLVAGASPTLGWNNTRANISTSAVARTSDTVVTITLPALPSYWVGAAETITATIPGSALAGASPLTATPTFQILPETPPARRIGYRQLGDTW